MIIEIEREEDGRWIGEVLALSPMNGEEGTE